MSDHLQERAIAEVARKYLIARYAMLREPYYTHDADMLGPLIDAEQDLWQAISGKKDLISAARAIGVRMVGPDADEIRVRRKARPFVTDNNAKIPSDKQLPSLFKTKLPRVRL